MTAAFGIPQFRQSHGLAADFAARDHVTRWHGHNCRSDLHAGNLKPIVVDRRRVASVGHLAVYSLRSRVQQSTGGTLASSSGVAVFQAACVVTVPTLTAAAQRLPVQSPWKHNITW